MVRMFSGSEGYPEHIGDKIIVNWLEENHNVIFWKCDDGWYFKGVVTDLSPDGGPYGNFRNAVNAAIRREKGYSY